MFQLKGWFNQQLEKGGDNLPFFPWVSNNDGITADVSPQSPHGFEKGKRRMGNPKTLKPKLWRHRC